MAELPGNLERLHERWRQGDRDDFRLFDELRDVMRRRARAAIWRATGDRPNDLDVDEAVSKAFQQLLDRDPARISALTGLASTIAYRRGLDIGKGLNRAREFPDGDPAADAADPDALLPEELVLEAEQAADRERLFRLAMECMDGLPVGQAEVVRATVLQGAELSDWAAEQGKTYEAARKQRIKALKALRKCVESKKDTTAKGGDHAR